MSETPPGSPPLDFSDDPNSFFDLDLPNRSMFNLPNSASNNNIPDEDDDDLDLEISDESFMEVLNTSPDLVDAIIDLIEESNREVAMIINPNLPQLDEDDDFTADEKAQMKENI